jgi:hypothetical protein
MKIKKPIATLKTGEKFLGFRPKKSIKKTSKK